MGYKCAIVGAGPHGMRLARTLSVMHGWDADQLALIDPSTPGYWWGERLKDCATAHLRSGPYDHVDCDRNSLLEFAKRTGSTNGFARVDQRPCVKLFNAHVAMVAQQLAHLHVQAEVTGLKIRPDAGLTVETTHGSLEADRVVLALGPSGPNYPEWATPEVRSAGKVCHIFDRTFERESLPAGSRVSLHGGGISAIQVALALVEEGHPVTICTRSPLGGRSASDPNAWSPEGLLAKLRAMDYEARYGMLAQHGDKGTLPEWEAERLDAAMFAGTIQHRVCRVSSCAVSPSCVKLNTDGEEIDCDVVVLATGFTRALPQWLKRMAAEYRLPLTSREEPQLGDDLQWGRSCVHVMGGYAAPILGPYADNLIGGPMAVEILLDSLIANCKAA